MSAFTPFGWGDVSFMLEGALVTLALCAVAVVLGCAVALPVGILRTLPGARPVNAAALLYIELFRSTPLLLQLFVVYFGLSIFGFDVPRSLAAGVTMTLYASAYLGEIVRAGIQAVARGQWEAASSHGLSYAQQLRWIVLPQAIRVILPSAVGFLVGLIKASSLTSIIGFLELSRVARIVVERTMSSFTVFGLVAVVYFLMCYPLSLLGLRLERRLGRGQGAPASRWA